jgi:hypothetical protein
LLPFQIRRAEGVYLCKGNLFETLNAIAEENKEQSSKVQDSSPAYSGTEQSNLKTDFRISHLSFHRNKNKKQRNTKQQETKKSQRTTRRK